MKVYLQMPLVVTQQQRIRFDTAMCGGAVDGQYKSSTVANPFDAPQHRTYYNADDNENAPTDTQSENETQIW